ncbi:hypothetical protein [Sulfuricurvum sp.]|uniref:hypothetical protein n=1 Tax=Sulfuricurvum sp. TaxID=2025608 RepID=UPI002D56CA82|nr:hypothetical protein [Sulfuricurvum sp.]HZF69834.1 hypothetical protein [Sulfuricurvum sp.]
MDIKNVNMSDYYMLPFDQQCLAFEKAMKTIDKNIEIHEPISKAALFFETEMSSYSESDGFIDSVRDFIKKHPKSFPSKKSTDQQLYLSDNGFVNTKAEATSIRDPESVEMVEEWLKENAVPSTKKYKDSSYPLKHVVEKELKKYISNGAFIQACINVGFKVERNDGGLNAWIYADFIGANPIKRVCKDYSLTYGQLADRIGYGEDAIKKAVSAAEISKPMAKAIELMKQNIDYERAFESQKQLKALLKDFIG